MTLDRSGAGTMALGSTMSGRHSAIPDDRVTSGAAGVSSISWWCRLFRKFIDTGLHRNSSAMVDPPLKSENYDDWKKSNFSGPRRNSRPLGFPPRTIGGRKPQAGRTMLKSRIFLLRVLMSTSSTRAAWALFQAVD